VPVWVPIRRSVSVRRPSVLKSLGNGSRLLSADAEGGSPVVRRFEASFRSNRLSRWAWETSCVAEGLPPTGTVSFLLTDIEASTRLWEDFPEQMAVALARHDVIVRSAISERRGYVFGTAGDGFNAAFWTSRDALDAATTAQRVLAAEGWPEPIGVVVRMGIHTGTADERGGDYFGPTLNRAARLMAAGHGGQILVSAATAQLLGPDELIDLGEQRLKDLATPERVYQVGGQSFPALRVSGPVTVRLPEWATRFRGRSDELDRLTERVPHDRVVVLTGPGGLGKTRLAAQIAQRLLAEFPDGVYFVGLAGIDVDAVDNAIADALAVRREPQRSVLESLAGWLRDRHVLLVLDNCEEVTGAAQVAISILLERCPGVHVLATSRLPLGIPGELRVPLPPLDESSAVELFVDRMVVTSPGFEVDRDRGALERLCRRLDGFPLALELAAARCRTLAPGQLLVRLERRPELLNDAAGLFEERHRDLDRLIAWSVEELSASAQRVLKRLTVVIGSFTLETAEAIAGEGPDDLDVVDALEELVDAGLIVDEQGDGEPRHRVLEPIRQHVAARLDASERTEAARRHGFWFAALARSVGVGSIGPRFGYWADLMERELANFRQAHRWAIEAGDIERAVGTVDGLAVVGQERGVMELADWSDSTVAVVEGRNDRHEVAALAAAVPFWWFQNRAPDIQAAVDRVGDVDADPEHHLALRLSAVKGALDPERWPEAIKQLEQALARYGSDRPTWWSAQIRAFLVLLGGLDESAVAPIADRLDSPVFSATFAFYRAVPYYLVGDEATAADLAGQAVVLSRAAGALDQLGTALMGHGGWRARLPEATLDDVFSPQAESLDLWDRLRIPWGLVAVAEEIAQSLAIRGYHEEAFVLWGAVDNTGIQAPSKVGRSRRTDGYIAQIPQHRAAAWRARGAAMTIDQTVAYARRSIAAVLS
jgi:predicted ATPase/class 3 adenylate cyclase